MKPDPTRPDPIRSGSDPTRSDSSPIPDDDRPTTITVPAAVRSIAAGLAVRYRVPVWAVIAEALIGVSGAGGFPDPGRLARYRGRPADPRGRRAQWERVESRVLAAVGAGADSIDRIRDSTETLSLRQVERAVQNALTDGRMERVGERLVLRAETSVDREPDV